MKYSILLNKKAIAIPFFTYKGRWAKGKNQNELRAILNYYKKEELLRNYINFELLEQDVEDGLYFDSSIPIGKGLGSSGAISAAILSTYGANLDATNHVLIRQLLINIENHFHGNSSGIDPLVSYYQKAIETHEDASLSFHELKHPEEGHFFLLDSKIKRTSAKLITHFNEEIANPKKRKLFQENYFPLVDQSYTSNKKMRILKLFFQPCMTSVNFNWFFLEK